MKRKYFGSFIPNTPLTYAFAIFRSKIAFFIIVFLNKNFSNTNGQLITEC